MRSRDRFRGCLISGAAGDALGYAVEFLREEQIFRRYGKRGITEYELKDGIAQISDDTQMTLFTANGLLLGTTQSLRRGIGWPSPYDIRLCYQDWLKTQETHYAATVQPEHSWLGNVPELYSPRAPGNTCLSALRSGKIGTPEEPINSSKGCGGIMRVAPVGLYFNDREKSAEYVCRFGAETAALTHGHRLGWMPAGMLAQIIHEITQNETSVIKAVRRSLETLQKTYPESEEKKYLTRLIWSAMYLAQEILDDLKAIHQLGEGWVAEETLAIAVYCAIKYEDDFDRALIAAVNHNGDSDSTGAITGNILGAKIGLSGIPAKYTEHLELRDLIIEVADDLWHDCTISPHEEWDMTWERKYCDHSYPARET